MNACQCAEQCTVQCYILVFCWVCLSLMEHSLDSLSLPFQPFLDLWIVLLLSSAAAGCRVLIASSSSSLLLSCLILGLLSLFFFLLPASVCFSHFINCFLSVLHPSSSYFSSNTRSCLQIQSWESCKAAFWRLFIIFIILPSSVFLPLHLFSFVFVIFIIFLLLLLSRFFCCSCNNDGNNNRSRT